MSSTPVKTKATSPAGSPVPSKSAAANLPSSGPGSPAAAATAASSPPAEPVNVDPVLTGALTGGHWLEQELPEDDTDGDSAVGSDAESSTASISSSIYAYRTINGRTYHSDSVTNGEYWGPNDKKHLECLEIYHHAIDLLIDHKLHMAPISKDIKKALDIGTGEGIWAIDFADEFDKCQVIATDITPVQPQWVPPNLQFEISDAEKEWVYTPNDFDFVHIRFLDGAIENWNALYREAYKVIKPGGWVEHLDHSPVVSSDDGSVKPGSAMDTYGKMLAEAGKKMGRTITLADDDTVEEGLKAAGFINIQSKRYRMPLSPWDKEDARMREVGAFVKAALASDVEGVVQYMFGTVMGWTQEQIKAFADHLRRELRDESIHGYYHWKYVWAQKPEDAE